MAYTTPRTWVDGEFVTAALLNVHLRDNLVALNTATPAAPTGATVATNQSTTSLTFAALTTAGPAVTVTIGASGVAIVVLSAQGFGPNTDQAGVMGFAISGATTRASSDTTALWFPRISGSVGDAKSRLVLCTGLTAGSNTFTAQYRSTTASFTAGFQDRNILVLPY